MTGKKELLARTLHASGLLSLLPHLPTWRKGELRILTYHRVFNVADAAISLGVLALILRAFLIKDAATAQAPASQGE